MFASLRANDLIWPYVVQGYLKGQAPPAFDLLFWNSDDTNLPGPMFCWYLRNTYLENKLREPGATVQGGVPVDLGAIEAPAFLYASKEDHIVPVDHRLRQHAAAVRRRRQVRARRERPHRGRDQPAGQEEAQLLDGAARTPASDADPEAWFAAAESVPGSWWPAWIEWLAPHSGPEVDARAAARQRRVPPDRAGPRPLRQGEGTLGPQTLEHAEQKVFPLQPVDVYVPTRT